MSFDLSIENDKQDITAYEASAWEPPLAPLDMPRQQLEAEPRADRRPGLLARAFSFLHVA
ncbi:hypothetical protein KM176_13850 [Pseudooceanicola sp. CBS1P-1]|uniref:Uncharacterized protein n=1 Tax=Pseudooceanicola albus TaxID=2692189 RepID=A0A6L7G3N5_9RHOB|nr:MULTISPECIES: hypothetical protein [Pseudooceanicola]MBT9384949.1 hypothetical protein [Pseudooceanicola endophyticus]MXN18056.1 hypothetical protein [Pseudooceanicola albus]